MLTYPPSFLSAILYNNSMGMFRPVTLSKELVQLGAQDLPPDLAAVVHSTYIDFDYLKETLSETSEITQTFVKIILGVLAIGENPDIVKPVVLRADEQKYQLTGDEKYIDKARRRGVIGFDIGADIPTKARLKQMVKENEIAIAQGRKAPHIRSACLALVHTGKGRALPKIVKRKGCYVNKELLTKTPQGFYVE